MKLGPDNFHTCYLLFVILTHVSLILMWMSLTQVVISYKLVLNEFKIMVIEQACDEHKIIFLA